MRDGIQCIERSSGKGFVEKVHGHRTLSFLYGNSFFARFFSYFLLPLVARMPVCSWVYGLLQKLPSSKGKIKSFIEQYEVDASEFKDPVDSFRSFNDFFIRKLKAEVRPVNGGEEIAVLPADGRYLVFPEIRHADGFYVKDQHFDLETFLQDPAWGNRFLEGSMVIARLCPSDYHRFHYPVTGKASAPRLVKGSLFSVNPIALKKKIAFLWENKRMVTEIETDAFGTVLMVEVGATCVGTIHQNQVSEAEALKGEEKGYFSFGGSCIVLLFEHGRIQFDEDLIFNSSKYLETRALYGASLGKALPAPIHPF